MWDLIVSVPDHCLSLYQFLIIAYRFTLLNWLSFCKTPYIRSVKQYWTYFSVERNFNHTSTIVHQPLCSLYFIFGPLRSA